MHKRLFLYICISDISKTSVQTRDLTTKEPFEFVDVFCQIYKGYFVVKKTGVKCRY